MVVDFVSCFGEANSPEVCLCSRARSLIYYAWLLAGGGSLLTQRGLLLLRWGRILAYAALFHFHFVAGCGDHDGAEFAEFELFL